MPRALPVPWLSLALAGFAGIYFALGVDGLSRSVVLSGSSLTTMGFAQPESFAAAVVSFVEAGIGLFLVALLITYLPAMYQSFARRELRVASLETAAGTPPFRGRDAAPLRVSVIDLPRAPSAELCIWAGYASWRRIAEVCEVLAADGILLKADRDAPWRAFNGWRVNYDAALLDWRR